jgi:hypothetical protein
MAKVKSTFFSEFANSNVVFGVSHLGRKLSFEKFEVYVKFVIIFGRQKFYKEIEIFSQ